MIMYPSLAEYEDPKLYDLENPESEQDVEFLLSYAREAGGPVLDLGCGTGRMTIPLAKNGIDITGLDIVTAMIERAKQKAGALPIEWIVGDARSFKLSRKFGMIFETGAVFQHMIMLEDQEALLNRAREHLTDGGRFIFSIQFPHADMLSDVPDEKDWYSYTTPEGREVKVSGTEFYDAIRQVKVETAFRRWKDVEGNEVVREAPLSLRYTFPQEMQTLLHYNGLIVESVFGDSNRAPLTAESRNILFVCRKE